MFTLSVVDLPRPLFWILHMAAVTSTARRLSVIVDARWAVSRGLFGDLLLARADPRREVWERRHRDIARFKASDSSGERAVMIGIWVATVVIAFVIARIVWTGAKAVSEILD
jgi:hypothetical protein